MASGRCSRNRFATACRAAPAAVLAALIALAGCGEAELTATDLVTRGDEICRQGQERSREIQKEPPGNAAEAVDQTDALISSAEDEIAALEELDVPDELLDDYDRYLAAKEKALELLRTGRDAAEDEDAEGYSRAQVRVAGGARERFRLAREIGFEDCSRPQLGPTKPSS